MWYLFWFTALCIAAGFGVINGVVRELHTPDPGRVAD